MNGTVLFAAALLCVAIGVAHSVLGERYILVRLFRREDLPKLFGSDEFTKRTLRFAWHVTSIAWWGFAALLVVLAIGERATMRRALLAVVAATFFVHALVSGAGSRGRHYSWIVFLTIAALTAFAAWTGAPGW